METYEVVQKILSFGPQYEVRAADSPEVLMTIQGKVLSMTPKLTMRDGEREVATMQGNFMKTKFECFDAEKQPLGTLAFPLIALKKGFTLTVGDATIQADGGFLGGEFECKDANGHTVMKITKQLSLRDKFAVQTSGAVPRDVALLAAVAIDQKFFQDA
jgi:uncharacterized protein YxjI